MNLSKSKYCNAVQCPKMLWLSKNKKEVYDESVLNQAVLEQGSEVGDLAMGLFGKYIEVPFGDLAEMISETNRLLEAGNEIIAEASFSYNGLFCSVDILKNKGNGHVELYEVKSSSEVHEIYYDDVAYQCYVLKKLGYVIDRVSIVHINTSYVRDGELDLAELFVIVDVTTEARQKLDEVDSNINWLESYMKQKEEPVKDISMDCFNPYECGFFKYCAKHLPSPNVFDVARLSKKKKFEYYNKGFVSFKKLYDEKVLSKSYLTQVEHEVLGLAADIDVDSIRKFMSTLYYPIYFLDFETFSTAIPLYNQSSPYQQIPFQYSLHYVESENANLQHKEFLAEAGEDPRRALAERLCSDIPKNVCVTAYNMGFEKGRIRELAEMYPDLSEHLMNIHDNIVDLMIPFQKKQYYQKEMQGSYSIKYVLPALFPDDPELNYSNLEEVHNGAEASNTFRKMVEMDPAEVVKYRKALLNYCKLDTYAMVKIWQKLNEIIGVKVQYYDVERKASFDDGDSMKNGSRDTVDISEKEEFGTMKSDKKITQLKCSKCGAILNPKDKYCDQCGSKIEHNKEEKTLAFTNSQMSMRTIKSVANEKNLIKSAYWEDFIKYISSSPEGIAILEMDDLTLPAPADRNWYALRLGTTKARIELQLNTQKKMIRTALFIKDEILWDKIKLLLSNKLFRNNKIHMDTESKTPSISLYKEISGININRKEQFDWYVECTLAFKQVYDMFSK